MLLLSAPALALDADTFEIAGSAIEERAGLQVVDPRVGHAGSLYGGLVLAYARNPLVAELDGEETSIVSDAFATHLAAGYVLGGFARFDADLPLYPWVGGAGEGVPGVASGDLRLSATVPVLRGETLTLGVVPGIALPTGKPAAFTGSGGVGASFSAAGAAQVSDRVALAANLGATTAPGGHLGETAFGGGLTLGAGGTVRATDTLAFGAELDAFVTLAEGADWSRDPVEGHLFGSWGRDEGVTALVGLGTGLVAGVGAPDARVIAAIAWRQPGEPPVYDRDADGLVDDDDRCPDTPEDADGFEDGDGCPDADNDRDGIADAADRCRDVPEDRDAFEDTDGCPDADNDRDSLADADDACPNEAGPVATKGCPDRDADLVVDARDKCPDEPRDPREDPARSDGCPKRVFVTRERIEITEKIFFATNKTTIEAQSFGLLGEIASVLQANPDLRRVEVAGHTDNVGSDKANLKLSQGRAQAVVDWLVKGGVEADRLVAKGYGEAVPLETNNTEQGRGVNRRVEFVIQQMETSGAAAAPAVEVWSAPAQPAAPTPAPSSTPAPAPAPEVWSAPAQPAAPAPAPVAPAPEPAPPASPPEPPVNPDDPFGLDEL
jgi:outer membrane protein OmpA-like peptidoglycan-associated protein